MGRVFGCGVEVTGISAGAAADADIAIILHRPVDTITDRFDKSI
jgi:hypothetical protein